MDKVPHESLINISLTEKQHSNLLTFLMRTDLKGNEVQAFIEIMAALNKKE